MPFFIERHATALFALPVVLGLALPEVGSWFAPIAAPLLFSVMTLSLLDVPILESLKDSLNAGSIKVLAVQYGLFGLLAYLASGFFPPELFMGFVVLAATPSGISAPAIVDLYGGDTKKSIGLTVLNNVTAPLWMPLFVMAAASRQIGIDPASLFSNLALFIFLPMAAAGAIARTPASRFLRAHKKPMNVLILMVLGWALVSKSAEFFRQQPLTALSVTAVLSLVALAMFFIGSKMGNNRADNIAYATVCYHRNYTLSITLLTTLFSPVAAAVGVAYLVVVHGMVALTGRLIPTERQVPAVRSADSTPRRRG